MIRTRQMIVEYSNWEIMMSRVADGEHVFAIGDIRGNADCLAMALMEIGRAPLLSERKRVISLGNVTGFGPDNLRTAQIFRRAVDMCHVGEVELLWGETEWMIFDAVRYKGAYIGHWANTGGVTALMQILPPREVTDDEVADIVRHHYAGYLDQILDGKPYATSGSVIFVPASIEVGRQSPRAYLKHHEQSPYVQSSPCRVQPGFLEHTGDWGDEKDLMIVHGTTPVVPDATYFQIFLEAANTAIAKARINIDAGCGMVGQLAFIEMVEDRFRFGWVQMPETIEEMERKSDEDMMDFAEFDEGRDSGQA